MSDKLNSSWKLAVRINLLNRNIFAQDRCENKSQRIKSREDQADVNSARCRINVKLWRRADVLRKLIIIIIIIMTSFNSAPTKRKVCFTASEDLTFAKQLSRLKPANDDGCFVTSCLKVSRRESKSFARAVWMNLSGKTNRKRDPSLVKFNPHPFQSEINPSCTISRIAYIVQNMQNWTVSSLYILLSENMRYLSNIF